MKKYEEKIYFNCFSCNKKNEKGSGVHYAESWFCNEDCIIEYIKINNIDLDVSKEDSYINQNDDDKTESDNDPDYDPMNDF